ncbi:SIR2 family NAD-dependent protein deacylase [Thauera sinica]|uniref:protein acetyllysine N-acetyltransferase n=1 Tax=Thauera sinica TaxID=2665146 RepID=A0ABW1AX10_9RHOO|nr:Sir2 family NAD-dependent protein deacetylase [Thauera sp. K11]ATE59898.1 NAD-dependent deacetylase [Thauera sp. K11]
MTRPVSATELEARFQRCARLIAQADGLLITAGAGLGVDSGLPDFRGSEGMWRAYPALGRAGMHFHDIASPNAFDTRPRLAWGFYGHRLALYRKTEPGPAFAILGEIGRRLRNGAFIFTSNVDGQFQKAGFDAGRIVECHGSIHHLQCMVGCRGDIWPADGFLPDVDAYTCKLVNALPHCPWCRGLARPNVLMFGDAGWIDDRTRLQQARLGDWQRRVDRLLVIEIGAGTAIPSVRLFGEGRDAPMIRINPAESATSADRGVSLPLTGTQAMRGIADALLDAGFLER